MRNYFVFFLFAMFIMFAACAKKQFVAPEVVEEIPVEYTQQEIIETPEELSVDVETVEFAEEPTIRNVEIDVKPTLNTIHFPLDSSDIDEEGLDILKNNAQYMRNNPNENVIIEGHCDERGSTEYNLALGQRRAVKVKEYYVQLGINPNRIATVSYGEEQPVDDRSNEAGWAQNRRAETKSIK